MNRRNFIALLTGALAAPVLLAPKRTFFLPPVGGWPNDAIGYTVTRAEIADNLYKVALARLVIPSSEAHYWNEELAAGRVTYDINTETMTMWERPPPETYLMPSAWDPRAPKWTEEPWEMVEHQGLVYRGNIQEREVDAYRSAMEEARHLQAQRDVWFNRPGPRDWGTYPGGVRGIYAGFKFPGKA
jgi:hypothetical protein